MRTGILLLMTAVFFAGCSKDDQEPHSPGNKTAKQLLTEKPWLITAAGFDDNENGLVDENENVLVECHSDNSYTFSMGGNGTISDGAVACTPAANADFTWKLINNDTELQLNAERYTILQLDETHLKIMTNIPWLNGDFLLVYEH